MLGVGAGRIGEIRILSLAVFALVALTDFKNCATNFRLYIQSIAKTFQPIV